MGFLRYLLAAAVVMVHGPANISWLPGGNVAVESFFILSGFYMALILSEQYARTIPFWLNRLLRLIPLYWLLLIITFAITLALRPGFLHAVMALPHPAQALVLLTNITVIGQDLLFYLTPDLTFTTVAIGEMPARLYPYLLIPPSWTLSLELTFYLLAPFLVRSLPRLVALAAASLALRLVLIHNGYSQDPFLYRFFPQEVLFFCLGAFAYHLLQSLKTHAPNLLENAARPLTYAITAWLFIFTALPLTPTTNLILWYTALTLALPFIFHATGKNRLSNAVGELSYPLYLCHILVIWILEKAAPHLPVLNTHPAALSLTILATATLFALALHKAIEKPIAPLRRKLRAAAH